MALLIAYNIISSNLEEVLFCCLLGCLFESFLFDKQKALRLCAFFIFSQRTVNDMQRLQGNKVAFFILVLYPAIRYSIVNIYNLSLLIQNVLLLFANYLFSVVQSSNNNKMQQKNSRTIQQNSQKNNNYSLNNQTDQSNFIQNGQDIYRISDTHNINQTKNDQSSINQIYNQTNNISILNDEDHPKFNSFHESKIKQTKFLKNESRLFQEREINIHNKNTQNLTLKDMKFKLDNNIKIQPQKNNIIDLILNQISVGIILLDSDKKLIYSNKILKKIINKGKLFENITELTYLLSLKLQTIYKFQKQYNQTENSINQSRNNISNINIHQQKPQQNTILDQVFQDQQRERESENNKHPKSKQKQNQYGSVIYNQYQTRKNIQQNNKQDFLTPKQKEYRKTTTVEVFSSENKNEILFLKNNTQNPFQNKNTKTSQSSQLLQTTSKETNNPIIKEKINKQDKTSNQSFINSKIMQSQLQFSKVVQCILPNNINKLFTKENLQIDDIIDFLMKYSSPPQYQKMNSDTQILEQSDEIISQFSNKQQRHFDNNGKIQNAMKSSIEKQQNLVQNTDNSQMLKDTKNDKNSSSNSDNPKQNKVQHIIKQEEGQSVFDVKNDNCFTKQKKKKVKKKLYDYFILNNYLHVTVQQEGNDLSFQEIKYFGIKLSVLQQTEMENHKFILIEASDITILKKQIDNESIDIYKNKILSSVSHELRTPLNCTIQMLEMLSQNDEISNIMKQIFILPALNSNLLLLNIVNDILDLAQINYGKFTMIFSQFELNQICTECINLISIQALLKNINIELDIDPNIPQFIHSDSVRIRQVLLNLLSNALKFTQVGKIAIRTKLIDETLIQIDIEDSGCGISEKNVNTLNRRFNEKDIFNFEQFQNNYKLNTIDIGLGLTITNNLATGLGGNRKLHVQSIENVGTKFSFWIVNHSKNKFGCKFTKLMIFNKEIIKWKSILDPPQQQKYLQIKNDSFKQSGNQNNSNTNIGQQQQNLSVRSRLKNEESSSILKSNKYQQSVQQLVKFNNEFQQNQWIHHKSISNDQMNQHQNKETLTNSVHNSSPINGKKLNKFQLSFNELSMKEDHVPILEPNSFPQNYGIYKAKSNDQISLKKQNKDYYQKSYTIQINETNSQESYHSSESKQQQMMNSKNLSKLSPFQYNKLINNNNDSISSQILSIQQERKNEQLNFGHLQSKNIITSNKLQNKTNSEFNNNSMQSQLSLNSNISNQNNNTKFNKSNSLSSNLPYTNQSTSETMNPQIQNQLKHQIYTLQQKSMQTLIDEQNEEQYNIISLDNYEIIQTPNQFFGQKVSEKRINIPQLSNNSQNIINLNDNKISSNNIGVQIKFQDYDQNQMYQKEVMQNKFFRKDLLSDSQRQNMNTIDLESICNQTLNDATQNDQIELIETNQTPKLKGESNEIQKAIKQPQTFTSLYDQNHEQQKQTLKIPSTQPIQQKNQIITNQNLKQIDIQDNKINTQLDMPQLLNPQSNTKQKIQSYTSQMKCQCANILIVDDNDFNIYALETRLKSYGFITDKATSGIIAVEKVKNKFEGKENCCKLYTLIFMDISMPLKDGYETTKDILTYLREKKVAKPPPISACTAFVQQTEQDKAKMCGMQYYITKPVNKEMLEEVLISVIFDIKN